MNQGKLAKPHVLCRYCHSFCTRSRALNTPTDEWIKTRDRIPDEEFEHCPNIFELKVLSDGGCHLCILLWNSIRAKTLQETIEFPAARDRAVSLRLWDPERGPKKVGRYRLKLTLQFREVETFAGSCERALWIRDEADIPLDENSEFADAQLSFSTQSRGIFRLAKRWLSQCEENHVACGAPTTQPNDLPTRLIDVEVRTDFDLRLHIVPRNDLGLKYLTLSHCWGDLDVFTLKSENITRMIEGFHLKELPKTFQDAVEVTRNLGFRYLWIDALCIIQDSVPDWKTEVLRMASIYENSVCTIAALFGANSHAGCFKSRQPLEHFSCRIAQNKKNSVFATSQHVFWDLID